jgi:hypothetical protein
VPGTAYIAVYEVHEKPSAVLVLAASTARVIASVTLHLWRILD